MRVVICWSAISGYSAACWRELSSRDGIDLTVIAHTPAEIAPFHVDTLSGIRHILLDERQRADARRIRDVVVSLDASVIVIVGWWLKHYRTVASDPRLRGVPKIMCADTPWRHNMQYLTRLLKYAYLRRLAGVIVPGERGWQYMRRLGFPSSRILRSMYAIDVSSLAELANRRESGGWPKAFLYVGRYVTQKGIDTLVRAYSRYREQVQDPWPLMCCGAGALAKHLEGTPGVTNLGFVQPASMPSVWESSGAFIMPSLFEPWGQAVVEAAASGLPVIATDACGAAAEMIRPYYNGLLVPAADAAALTNAMRTIHSAPLPLWGRRSQLQAEPFDTAIWADRWIAFFKYITELPR